MAAGRPPATARRRVVALALVLAAAAAAEGASRLIAVRFPGRPAAPDLLYGWLPHTPAASYVTLAAMSAMLVLFLVRTLRSSPGRLPEYLTVLALMYLLRAPMLVLTPLAAARDGSVLAFPLFVNGLFPSGHTALAFMLARLTDAKKSPGLHAVQVALLGVVIVTMLLSRDHYSIDIIGGLLLGYFVSHEWSTGHLFSPLKHLVTAETPEPANGAAVLYSPDV